MSGRRWTPEQKAARSKAMKKRWRDPAYRGPQVARLRGIMQKPENRAAASERMSRLNARMRLNEKLAAKRDRGQRRARRLPAFRALQSAVMTELMARRPDLRKAASLHLKKINRDPKVRRRQGATRRRNREKAKALQARAGT